MKMYIGGIGSFEDEFFPKYDHKHLFSVTSKLPLLDVD